MENPEKRSWQKILPLYFSLIINRNSEITTEEFLPMDSWAITRHRWENRVNRWKIVLFWPKSTPQEWWSLVWWQPSSHVKRMIETMRRWWSLSQLFTKWLQLSKLFLILMEHKGFSQWDFLPEFAPRSCLLPTATDSQSFSFLVDARWDSPSLHEWSFSFFERQVWRSSHQPENWSPGFESAEFLVPGCCQESSL